MCLLRILNSVTEFAAVQNSVPEFRIPCLEVLPVDLGYMRVGFAECYWKGTLRMLNRTLSTVKL